MTNPPQTTSKVREQEFQRILLIKPSSLGDVIHALPVLHGLRARYPNARIDWLISAPLAPMLASHPELDDLIPFDRHRFGRIGRNLEATREFVRFLRDLRERRYDLVIDLQGLFRTGFIAWACGSPVRVGFGDAREGAKLFYTQKLVEEDPNIHAVDKNYGVARLLGFEAVPLTFSLPSRETGSQRVAELLRDSGVGGDETMILVAPGARWDTKRWLSERFSATIDTLQDRRGVRCLLVGSADEVTLCERIASKCLVTPVNLAGRTDLAMLPALVRRADLVLCQDSAILHLAVALERPLVCLIGPTNPRRTGPYRRYDDVVRVECRCSPCYLRKKTQCRYDHRCMNDLDVERVVGAVERRLELSAVSPG